MSAHTHNSRRSYFDYNATSPLAEGVADAVVSALELPGNPSSLHAEGRRAQALLDASRETVAQVLSASALDVVFTSGGTEANHLGLLGLARAASAPGHVLVPPTVHPSLWAAGQRAGIEGPGLLAMPVHADGRVDLAAAKLLLANRDVAVMGVSLANHEIGCVEDIESLSKLCRDADCLLFCDAVQALGRIPVTSLIQYVDGLSLSAHKIGGPKGVGALWLRPGPALDALIGGGKQEAGRRPGTQALALIAGFAAACAHVEDRLADVPRQRLLRDQLQDGLGRLGAVFQSTEQGLCNTVSARFPGVPGEILVTGLDLAGVAASTGAACSSGTTAPSPVMLGIGLGKREALEALRLSIGPGIDDSDVKALLEVLPPILERAKRFA